ncbi:multimerin-2 [Ambystoma mexicanum]|uniref:multimerin-2 n=1 Tax=Ambystoma mexicanum TaxID=8296 RepID=UPI0037E9C1E5
MLWYLLLICCAAGPVELVLASRQGYNAGGPPLRASLEVHGISRYPHGMPSREAGAAQVEPPQDHRASSLDSSSSVANEEPGAERPGQRRGNWCSFVHSTIVTFVASCMTEKYVIKSQQPCPHGSECQKIMYRVALKPVYQVKQKVLTSVQWKCCPGYSGRNCQHNDPNAIPIPAIHITGTEREKENPYPGGTTPTLESTELTKENQDHRSTLADLQNDVHQATSSLVDLQILLKSNITTGYDINQTDSEFQENILQKMLLPYLANFLHEHFNPVWTSFNKSLQDLSNKVQNLSENVELNRKNIEKFHLSAAAKKDLQELGTKFESKIQENVVHLDQLKRDVDSVYHAQETALHNNISMVKADTDVKIKRNHKLQQAHILGLNTSIEDMRRGQEILQDEIQALNRNITVLWLYCGTKEVENTQDAIHQMNETLEEHERQIKDLYQESDAAFENINTLEKWFKDLRTLFKTTDQELRTLIMEKDLILEENKVAFQRQLVELNYTIMNLQESNEDLLSHIKNCDCQKLIADLYMLEEDKRNITSVLKDIFRTLAELRLKERYSQNSLQNSVEDLSMALHPIQQTLASQQDQNRNMMQSVTQLSSQAKIFLEDVSLLKKEDEAIQGHIKNLDSSFSSLLEDAMRHDRALEALLGEEIMEVLSEEQPEALKMSIFQVHEVLNATSKVLETQQSSIEALTKRIQVLEMQSEAHSDSPESYMPSELGKPTESTVEEFKSKHTLVEHMEPNHEAARDDHLDNSIYNDLLVLKKDVKHMGLWMKNLESHLTESNFYCNKSLARLTGLLNISMETLKGDIVSLDQRFGEHLNLFERLFKNAHEFAASNMSLDLAKVHSLLTKKFRKQQRPKEPPQKRDTKHTKELKESIYHFSEDNLDAEHYEEGSSVAFYAGFSEGDNETTVLHFNELYLNYGNGYILEEGIFQAPHQGVYIFIISVEFGPGPAMGDLVMGTQGRIPLHKRKGKEHDEGLVTNFAMVELKEGEMVWFEVVQGIVAKRSPPGTLIGGYLIFKT